MGNIQNIPTRGAEIILINKEIQEYCTKNQQTFIDLYRHFKNENDEKLNPKYTNDGLHLMGDGYFLWKELVMKYIEPDKEQL